MIPLFLLSAYLLGNILTGALVSKYFYHKGIHSEGSGNPGARNAGRLFGKKAFIATFLGDAFKGALVIWVATGLEFDVKIKLLAFLAVTVGHIYPIFYKFRGGKGISTFIGGHLLFDPILVFGIFILIFLLLYPFIKSFTLAGMSAVLALPIIYYLYSYDALSILITCLLSGLIIYVQRQDILTRFSKE